MSPNRSIETRLKALVAAFKAAAMIDLLKEITAEGTLATNGKKLPKQGLPGGSGIKSLCDDEATKSIFIPISKMNAELQEVTGIVLQPEVTDAQGDIMSAEVIEKAAGDFLAAFNKNTKLGFMHNDFTKSFELRQSFIMPGDAVIANALVRKGAWMMVVKVKDAKIWKAVKDGKITGFSIGGKAKTQKLVK